MMMEACGSFRSINAVRYCNKKEQPSVDSPRRPPRTHAPLRRQVVVFSKRHLFACSRVRAQRVKHAHTWVLPPAVCPVIDITPNATHFLYLAHCTHIIVTDMRSDSRPRTLPNRASAYILLLLMALFVASFSSSDSLRERCTRLGCWVLLSLTRNETRTRS